MPDVTRIVDAVFDEVLGIIRGAQEANLLYAWRLGRVLDQALNRVEDRYGRSIAKELVNRLQAANCEISLSSLYAYRAIFLNYQEADIPDLVAEGLTQTHAQTLAALPTALRKPVEERMRTDDGGVVSTRELKRIVNDLKKENTREQSVAVAERASQAREDGDSLTLVAQIEPQAPTGTVDAEVVTMVGGVAPHPGQSGDVERSKAMAKGTPNFSTPPLRVLKGADSQAIKMMAQTSQLLVTLDELGRVGFDSDRSQQNALDATQSLLSSLESYQRVLPELITRAREAISANMIHQ